MKLHNHTNYDLTTIQAQTVIIKIKNNWRQRNITLYEHPTDKSQVISVGITFNGETTIVSEEPRESWARELDSAVDGFVETF